MHVNRVGTALEVFSLPHIFLVTAALFDEADQDRPYAYSYARLVPHLTYGSFPYMNIIYPGHSGISMMTCIPSKTSNKNPITKIHFYPKVDEC
jgi:hypothetical protein